MTWLAFIAALAKSAPLVLKLITLMKADADRKAAQGIGRDEAVADGLREQSAQLSLADEVVAEAKARHAAHPGSDDGFDTTFRRD